MIHVFIIGSFLLAIWLRYIGVPSHAAFDIIEYEGTMRFVSVLVDFGNYYITFGLIPSTFLALLYMYFGGDMGEFWGDQIKETKLRGGSVVSALKFNMSNYGMFSRLQFGKEKLKFPYEFENQHSVIVGVQGSGKTQIYYSIMRQLDNLKAKDSWIVLDQKPEFYERFYRQNKDIYFWPGRGGIGWQILDEIESESDLDFFVSVLNESSADTMNSTSEHFQSQSIMITKAVILTVKKLSETESERPSNKYFIDFLNRYNTERKLRHIINETGAAAAHGVNINGIFTFDAQGASSFATCQRIFNKLKRRELYYEHSQADLTTSRIIKEAARRREGGLRLFILNPDETRDSFKDIYRLYISFLARRLLQLQEQKTVSRRIHFFLDEISTLGNAPTLAFHLPSFGRSRGACVWQGWQNLEGQVQEQYGRHGVASVMSAGGSKFIFSIKDPSTAKTLESAAGDIEVRQSRTGRSAGYKHDSHRHSEQNVDQTKKLILASEFLNLPNYSFYLFCGNKIVKLQGVKMDEIPVLNPLPRARELPLFEVLDENSKNKKPSQSPVNTEIESGKNVEIEEKTEIEETKNKGLNYDFF